MLNRIVQPEILDSLPEDHPDALKNRRDLVTLNQILGNNRWFRKQLSQFLQPGDRLLEVGAGGGEMGASLFPDLQPLEVEWTGLDAWSRPAHWPESWAWCSTDLLQFQDFAPYQGILGNLILHQFQDEELHALGKSWNRSARFLLFSEPRRHPLPLHLLQWTRLLGMHPTTRHDGAISIRAGFRGEELPEILGLDSRAWDWTIQTTTTGSYRLMARKRNLS